MIFGKLQKMSKSLEKSLCSVYTIYVNMNGNEVLPRLLPKPLLLMTSVFEQGHWLFLCEVLCGIFEEEIYEEQIC